jgi:hypothetical protein
MLLLSKCDVVIVNVAVNYELAIFVQVGSKEGYMKKLGGVVKVCVRVTRKLAELYCENFVFLFNVSLFLLK